jgi:hypothetical protein
MSLISRVEVTNYLTEGINSNRRVADWSPMLTGITLRMDGGRSTLVNMTNGAGKTSLVELLMYVLSRDGRLLKRLRDKVAPKSRGFTHARIEFREPPDDGYVAPSLLERDLDNHPGKTHVVGVVLNDDVTEQPVFYSYSGTLEDSRCFHNDGSTISGVSDAEFTNRTKSMPGCKWNKFNSRKEWEDQISLFLSVEVIRRNVAYQLKGSDDKNASFFDFQPRGGESYDSAFFRSVVAPDLLTNLLNSFSDEDELTVEDTLHKSLSRIVAAEKEVGHKQKHLVIREAGIQELQPILDAGRIVKDLQSRKDSALRGLRKDVALACHFGDQDAKTAIAGLPRPLKSLPRSSEQDPRGAKALNGIVITSEDGLLIQDKTMSELSGVEVRVISQVADRKGLSSHVLKSQVIDLNCDFENHTFGTARGGHYRKGYSRASAIELLEHLKGSANARLNGLDAVLTLAFDIAETQVDTNPAAIEIRRLSGLCLTIQSRIDSENDRVGELKSSIEQMESQILDRKENQAAWDDFVKVGRLLPEELREYPSQAHDWLKKRLAQLKQEIAKRNVRRGNLSEAWKNYIQVLEHVGLEGMDGVRNRHQHLVQIQKQIQEAKRALTLQLGDARQASRSTSDSLALAQRRRNLSETELNKFAALCTGFVTFKSVFGDILPEEVNPVLDFQKTEKKLANERAILLTARTELDDLVELKSQSYAFASIFGEGSDPLSCDPIRDDRHWSDVEASAQVSMAALLEKVEALDAFEAMAPNVAPKAWIEATDMRRRQLEEQKKKHSDVGDESAREITAIGKMQVADDGAFRDAWSNIERAGLDAQRLHSVMLKADKPIERRTAALSALSGMLSSPVFDTIEQLETAATMLGAAGVSVPLVLKDALLTAMDGTIASRGDVRLFGFIGGNYSRHVRILLEPEYAQSELLRLREVIAGCDASIAAIDEALKPIHVTGDSYMLAVKAQEAIDKKSREKYREYQSNFESAQAKRSEISPRLTKGSLEVLRCAVAFVKKGGADRAVALDSKCSQLGESVKALEALNEVARVRASYENQTAHRQAREYVEMGGKDAHALAASEFSLADEAFHAAEGLHKAATATEDQLEIDLDRVNTRATDFDNDQSQNELDRLNRAVIFHESGDDATFMEGFDHAHEILERDDENLTGSLSVNFKRAATFKDNLNESDQQLQVKLGTKKQELETAETSVRDSVAELRRIEYAEIPEWIKVRRTIHELAWELGRRVALTREASQEISSLEEGDAVAETHPSYRTLQEISQTLRSPSMGSSGRFVETVNEAVLQIQSIDLEGAMREFEEIDQKHDAAVKVYVSRNSSFCADARARSGARDSAFNALEIEEIEKADPLQMQALAALFDRMKVGLEKDRQDAQRAKDVAEGANQESIKQLSGLIRIAQDNLATLEKVMARYPDGRFFVSAQIAGEDRIREILSDLKDEVVRSSEMETTGRTLRRSDDTKIKQILRDTLIDRVFMEPEVAFVNGGIWSGKRSAVTQKLSTGQKIALEFMWIVRQAEYEIERGLRELSSKQAAKSRSRTNRVIMIDGIFSTLSDRGIIKEALNGLKGLGGNFQIIGFLHSPTWTNDYEVFPVYHVGKKLTNRSGNGLVSFAEAGRLPGSVGFFSSAAAAVPSVAAIQ